MIILGFVLIGFIAGYAANFLVGKGRGFQAYELIAAGLVGSFVGGTLGSLLLGEGFDIRPGGIIGSTIGAVIILLVWGWFRGRQAR